MGKGIICLETEWEHTIKKNKLSLHSEPLLEFIKKSCNCKIIYRRIATRSELEYYLLKFSGLTYKRDFSILYLSFHGNTRAIQLEGEKSKDSIITLDELSKIAPNVFANRFVHFSSCRTMLGSHNELLNFKESTGAIAISGYTKSVNSTLSAINDIAYFHQIFEHPIKRNCIKTSMNKLYEGLNKNLGFKII